MVSLPPQESLIYASYIMVHDTLCLGNVGEKLQDDVRDQDSREVSGTPLLRIQQECCISNLQIII